ncbi:hypothetical protein TNCV_2863511 [Trichonephila clavipes]|nr:hypothetical protein TNCV_2863511 [Trichonephila clavipes]
MEFKSFVTFRWISGISSNLFLFKARLSRGNRKRSGELRSGGHIKIMFDPSSFANPTPLAHADTSRDVLPRGGTSQLHMSDLQWRHDSNPRHDSYNV